MFSRVVTATLIFSSLALAGCQSMTRADGGVSKQGVGTLAGAAIGGMLASDIGGGSGRTVATIGGTLLGAFIGSEIGKSLDRADLMMLNNTQQQALEYNRDSQRANWSNPNSGNAGAVTPTRTYYTQGGEPCRQFEQTIIIDGQAESAYGTACRGTDGVWRIQ